MMHYLNLKPIDSGVGINNGRTLMNRFAAYSYYFGFAGFYNPQGQGGSSSRIN